MVFSKQDQHDSAPDRRAPREKPTTSGRRNASHAVGPDAHADALRIAVETLSAEICWFLAGQTAGPTSAMESPTRPPTR
jgi:hypothetical protein